MKEPPRERLSARGLRVAIVRALFNRGVTYGLLEGALLALGEIGAARRDVAVFDLPGAFELPLAAPLLLTWFCLLHYKPEMKDDVKNIRRRSRKKINPLEDSGKM